MKVLVITPGVLPVPATKGGAVEKLIEEYINFNEKFNEVNFTVYSVKSDANENLNYKNTEFRYIDDDKLIYKVEKAIRWGINNKLPKIHIGNVFINRVVKDLKKRKEKYDLIIVENIPYNVLFIKKIFPDTKIIYHIHNDFLNVKTKKGKKILEKCDKVIAISKYLMNRIKTIAKTDNIIVVYNGIDIEKFKTRFKKEEILNLRRKYNFNDKDIIFLFVGRFVKEKGVKELVQAFVKLLNKNPLLRNELKLLIVGSKSGKFHKKDKYRLDVEKIAQEYNNNIKFTGFISYGELPRIYQISDVQVVPSNWGEPFGNVVVEGMASGINQIVTNDGGIPEIIENFKSERIIMIDSNKLVDNLLEAMETFLFRKKDLHNKYKGEDLNQYSEDVYCEEIFNVIKDLANMERKYENK